MDRASEASMLKSGLVGRANLLDDHQFERAAEIVRMVEADGLETVRLCFVDQHGILRGKAIVASALASAFRNGVAMTSTLILKDTSNRTVFDVWGADAGFGPGVLTGAGDILMVPDPDRFHVLPWSPHSALLLCDIHMADGGPLPVSTRAILRNAVAKLGTAGLDALFGLELEFHVYRVTNPRLDHADGGMPATPPETALLAHGYQYLTESRYGALEPVMDDIRRAAQALGLPVRSMEVEFGPGQLEFTFDPAGPLAQADATVLFRYAAREVCRRNGLHATFMTRPRVDNAVGSGWHIHQSLVGIDDRANRFMSGADGAPSPQAGGWIAGLLDHAVETCLLTTPTVNGYRRYQPHMLAPDRVQWAYDNKGAMIRALMRQGDPASRIENRTPESAANPHLVFAAQILTGLDGIARGLKAPPPADTPYEGDGPALPRNLGDAIAAFSESAFWRGELGDGFVDYFAHIKSAEWNRYLSAVSEWEHREYFSLF